jgi:hypothetical protein
VGRRHGRSGQVQEHLRQVGVPLRRAGLHVDVAEHDWTCNIRSADATLTGIVNRILYAILALEKNHVALKTSEFQ